MVFYFTGTGNSLYLARELDGDHVSIPQAIHNKELNYKAERIGIVAPVYGHELPEMVCDFLNRAVLDTPYLYVIATYGSGHSGAGAWIQELLRRSGKTADYINVILMPDNYLPGFDMAEQAEQESRLAIDEKIAEIKADLLSERQYILPANIMEKMMHKQAVALKRQIVTEEFIRNLYTVTDACVGCGVCAKVCPAGCFSVSDGQAVQTPAGCQMCMACIHACPQRAIRLNMPEPNPNARFRNSHVSLADIIAANRQGMD